MDEEDEKGTELEFENSKKRWEFEWYLLRDPKTNKIPKGIREKELELLKTLPVRKDGIYEGMTTTNSTLATEAGSIQNRYIAAGPSQNGGRTRTTVFDKRYNGTSNRIVLAAGINGGIFRSTDGGTSWVFVHPPDQIRNVSTLAQDTRTGFENTWYAGTGEVRGASAGYPSSGNNFVFGEGIFKSTDNGITWSKLNSTNISDPTLFTSQWNFIHKIVVHPVTGHVYAAIHRRIVRSINGGSTWESVFESTVPTTPLEGICDIIINRNGTQIIVGMTGRNADRNLSGVWISTTGDAGSYTRIAGAGLNSPLGWRAWNNTTSPSGDYLFGWGRVALALAPSNQNILYVMVENTDQASLGLPEADLFRCDMSTAPFTWRSLGPNLIAKRNVSGKITDNPIELQKGYNMLLAIHPTNPNLVLAGGVNLFKSTDGFLTKNNNTFIGGLESLTFTDPDNASHVDFHAFAFDPVNPNRLLVASDGGIAQINDVLQSNVTWSLSSSRYQTIQYYHVGIDPTPGSRTFFGGAQDNSTTFRDANGLIGALPDSNDHYLLIGGDGGQVGMTKKDPNGKQYLFGAAQNGLLFRTNLFPPFTRLDMYKSIKPNNTGEGVFVTNFHLDPDNTDLLYFAMEDSLFTTNQSTTVTAGTWKLMDSVHPKVIGDIYSLETTRGAYSSFNHLFIGSGDGHLYRIRNPQNPSSPVVEITPPGITSGAVIKDIAVNPRNQDTLLAVVSNYNVLSIFWTGNSTAASPTWELIEGNLTTPSIRSCEIIAKTTGVEYYVGTTIGLFSTTKIAGPSTEWLREVSTSADPSSQMLNAAIVNSLASRWSDNTLVIGTHGNGMFATPPLGNPVTVTTAVFTPIRNNPGFIYKIFPTATTDWVQYKVGDMFTIRKLTVQATGSGGQVILRRQSSYQDGSIDLSHQPPGMYIITITSSDGKYQHTSKVFKR
ncbi:MAG: hypothetical protein ACKO03_04740 [Bacteroidota bacterium]